MTVFVLPFTVFTMFVQTGIDFSLILSELRD